MKLTDLIKDLKIEAVKGDLEKEIFNIAYHTKSVNKGDLFVAIEGSVVDGHHFIDDAILRGACCVIAQKEIVVDEKTTLLLVENSRRALAQLSSRYFEEPSSQLKLVGITGTNGKTTITYLLESIFIAAGLKPGVIGTVEHRFAGKKLPSLNTTPESYELQRILKEMISNRVDACAMEVSSHALALDRVVGCDFDCAIFTNLSWDHLDFHQGMDNYFDSKARLFLEHLIESRKNFFAVINADDLYGKKIINSFDKNLFSYSIGGDAEVRAQDVICNSDGVEMKVSTPNGKFLCSSKLVGRFNVYNILAAVSAGVGLDLSIEAIKRGVESLNHIPGRLERVKNNRGLLALVDYAHTPDALEKVLANVRALAPSKGSRLIVVFGCGGDRDKKKRPIMGSTVQRFADKIIVTSDNPRNEDPDAIIKNILSGMNSEECEVIPDRRQAIKYAASIARQGDILLVAGKGHENYQIVGNEVKHFDDREVLMEFIN